MTDTQMTGIPTRRLKSARAWLVITVVATGAAGWVFVADATSATPAAADYRGAVGLAVVLGSVEAAYLSWRNWAHAERGLSVASATVASLGSLLIAVGSATQADSSGAVSIASGVGLLGIASFVGIFGMYRATGKSSAVTLTGMTLGVGLAYLASMLWSTIPS